MNTVRKHKRTGNTSEVEHFLLLLTAIVLANECEYTIMMVGIRDAQNGEYMEKQIKSKKRVFDFGEVYTAQKQVKDMVDMVHAIASEIEATVLEPACGNGNFLVEILSRKQEVIAQTSAPWRIVERDTLKAVASIYGVDILKDNVLECRERLYQQVVGKSVHWTPLFCKLLRDILNRNIMCGDTLSMMTDSGSPLTISEWDFRENGSIVRKDVFFSDMVANGGESTNYIRCCYYRWIPKEKQRTA